jgi:hypothetical protein
MPDDETAELVCDVGAVRAIDVAVLDALARLQLTARRLGLRVVLRHASAELLDLLDFTGVGEAAGLRVEAQRQPEEREEVLRVEEERQLDDPAV